MDEVAFDPNDLLRQFDSVSLSQRSLVAECERQRNRLIELLRWYDHQKIARTAELRRQSERIDKETRRQINTRSKIVIKARARVKHLLDGEDRTPSCSASTSQSHVRVDDHINDRKRRVYGCSLPQFKAPTTKSSENWSQFKSHSTLSESTFKKRLEKQRWSINKFIESPIEQRKRMNMIMNKCINEFEQCNGDGYDHFLQTCKPNRNTQILAQQK